MTNEIKSKFPKSFDNIVRKTETSGFTMASEVLTCSLLRTLAASKPKSNLIELGTGTGLATSWILDGMSADSTLTSIDNDPRFLEIARQELESDKRLNLICMDGGQWIEENRLNKYDFIFADTWHGKFLLLDETLDMLNEGGIYIIDDMLPQANWPEGHSEKVDKLVDYLERRADLLVTGLVWASGVMVAVKR